MKKNISILLIAFLAIALLAGCSTYNPEKRFTLEEMQEDMDEMHKLGNEYHTYLFTDEKAMDEVYKKQAGLLRDGMTELEFYRVLSPILQKLHCGHSYMKFSKGLEEYAKTKGNYIPLKIKVIDNKAYVLKDINSGKIPAGSEILEINGKPTSKIIDVFMDNVSSDGENLTFINFKINRDFHKLFFAHFDNTKEFVIKYKDYKDNSIEEAKLAAISMEKLEEAIGPYVPTEQSKMPKLEIFEDKGYGVLTVSSFDYYGEAKIKVFNGWIDKYFEDIKNSGIKNLIIDFRGNIGGGPEVAAHLLTYLTSSPIQYFAKSEATEYYKDLTVPMPAAVNNFTGNIYTLIDGGGFSTTGHICSLMKYHKIGVFVGEETGGSFVCSDGSGDAELKNTKLVAHGSTMVFATAVEGFEKGRGIMPDYPVVPTIDDYVQNRDIVKEFAVNLMSR